jgi:hypothetical protein
MGGRGLPEPLLGCGQFGGREGPSSREESALRSVESAESADSMQGFWSGES